LLVPSIASKYCKLKAGETDKEKFIKRIKSMSIIAIIILIIEGFYFRGMQNNVIKTINLRSQNDNEIENAVDETENTEDDTTYNIEVNIVNDITNTINDVKE
jgi:hypothetical protein